jgi:hypothetical protein
MQLPLKPIKTGNILLHGLEFLGVITFLVLDIRIDRQWGWGKK